MFTEELKKKSCTFPVPKDLNTWFKPFFLWLITDCTIIQILFSLFHFWTLKHWCTNVQILISTGPEVSLHPDIFNLPDTPQSLSQDLKSLAWKLCSLFPWLHAPTVSGNSSGDCEEDSDEFWYDEDAAFKF
jgi:hypothetical protein